MAQAVEWPATIDVPADASTVEVRARATDGCGMTGDEAVVTFDVDTNAPTVTLNLPQYVTGSSATLGGTASDAEGNVAQVEVQLDSETATWQSGQVYSPDASGTQNWNYPWGLPSEDCVAHTVRARATDTAGNTTVSGWGTVTVDNVPPSVDVTQVLTEVLKQDPSDPVVLEGTASDGCDVSNLEVVVYAPDGTSYREAVQWDGANNWQYAPDFDSRDTGDYVLRVEATDGAGNVTRKGPFDLLVKEGAPPSNNPPTVTADNATVTVDEGLPAINSGTFGDVDAGDTVTLNASVGTVTDNGDDTWSWSLDTDDGPTDSQTVTITATDSHGAQSTATFDLEVSNVPPTANFGNDGPVDEGSSFTLSLTGPSDSSTADTNAGFEYAFGCGNGSGYGMFSFSNSATCATTDDGTRAVKGQIRDKDGGATEYTTSVAVNNVTPTVTAPAGQTADEATATSFSLGSFADPGDDDPWLVTVDWGDLSSDTFPASAPGTLGSLSHTYADDGSYTVIVSVSEKNGAGDSGSASFQVTVANLTPTADDDSGTVSEDGPAITIDVLANDSDPAGAADPLTVSGLDTTGTIGSVSFTADDVTYDPNGQFESLGVGETASDTFSYSISDGNGGTASATVAVTINGQNDAPVASNDVADVNEDSFAFIYVLDNDTDVDGDTLSIQSVTLPTHGLAINNITDVLYSLNLDYCGTDSFTYTVSDGNGGTDTATVNVSVTCVNDAPVANDDSASTDEDTPVTIYVLANDTDVEDDTLTVESVTQPAHGTVTNNSTDVTYIPSAGYCGDDTFTYTADDGNGGTDDATVSITVTCGNAAPVVGEITAPVAPIQVNLGITASADFTDTNTTDTHTAVWDWGDGSTSSGTVTEANGSGSVSGSHTYTTPGVYTVGLRVTDNAGASGESVFRYVVVYDPEGGFVTGGGWIWSPASAYTPDPSLTGKANFGFVSKYKKGATVPTGETEFRFKAGNLNFHSDTYEWLVVAGANAKYKGVGTINGSGSFRFMITATDGNLLGGGVADGFRIKIWNDSGVVYDNKMGEPDDSNATTELGGGSIVIHKSK
jgi:hypothetical protein